ncbi:MAG: glycosyltransferase, partial [Clostridia bacterium]
PLRPWSLARWVTTVQRRVQAFRPDVIWACSDAFHAILGVHVQRRTGIPCVVDLYDNFESFGATAIPGVRRCYRASVKRAAGVSCVSRPLQRLVREGYGARGELLLLENGTSEDFRPLDRLACRRRLGLPDDARVIGTAGALDADRGIGTLFDAFLGLAGKRSDLYLVLAGPLGRGIHVPSHERVRFLGNRPLAEVPQIIGAMDVAVVCNKRSEFGEYCFPQKLYEIIACGVPPLVADTRGVTELLHAAPRNRYQPESVESLQLGIEALLAEPSMPPIRPVSWAEHAGVLADFFALVAGPRPAQA